MTREIDDDSDDRKFVYLVTSRNHFAVFYKDRSPGGNSGRLAILSFAPDKSVQKDKIYEAFGLDDDNHYGFMNDNILVGGVESKGWFGQHAVAYHFMELADGNFSWYKEDIQKLHGVLGYVDVMSMGEDYFVLRHNDQDDMSMFVYDGEKWDSPPDFLNQNMVHHQDFDPRTEAEWDAISGYNFFVARRPWIDEGTFYNTINPGYEFELIEKDFNGVWKRGSTSRHGNDHKKHIFAGTNWLAVKEIAESSVNNGREWKDEKWDHSVLNYELDDDDIEKKFKSINGDFLIRESNGWSILYYKKHDSFKSSINAFFVTHKIVHDSIIDKNIDYAYVYKAGTPARYPSYDYVSKSPIVYGVTVFLPEKGTGAIEKVFCDYSGDKIGVAKGQICKESFYPRGSSSPTYVVERFHNRYRGPNNSWPGFIYVDQVDHISYKNNHLSSAEYYTYANELNGLANSIKIKDLNTNKNVSEERKTYAAEIDLYSNLKKENRLAPVAAVYGCIPNCDNGKVVSGRANKYSEYATRQVDGTIKKHLRISEEWEYAPLGNERDNSFTFTWDKAPSASWTNTKKIEAYSRNIATQVENQLGIKSSLVLDKGSSNIIHANVVNAGLDEILIMSGDTCGIENWTSCDIAFLDGRYFEKENVAETEKHLYGRFSNRAISITKTQKLSGKINHAKKAKYRFSAWVQGTNYGSAHQNLILKIGYNYNKSFTLEGNGKWEYVEWITDKELNENNEYSVSLSSSDESEIHLQDIRFVPEDAFVQVEFWDKFWNKPIASLNNQSVAAYATYDFQGRLVNSYGETSSRKIYLTSKNTYISALCGTSNQEVSLKKLVINGIDVPVTETPGPIEIDIDNNTDELNISWETSIDGQKVFYRMYKKGNEYSTEYVEDDCCASTKQLIQKFDGPSMVLDIAVSTTTMPYTITINKSTVGWIDYGKNLGDGERPIFLSGGDVSGVYFIKDGTVKRSFYQGSEWKTFSEKFDNRIADIGSIKNNNTNYVYALPNFMGFGSDSYITTFGQNAIGKFASVATLLSSSDNVLRNQGDFEGPGVTSRLYKIASNVDKTESYVIYEKTVSTVSDEKKRDEKKPMRNDVKNDVIVETSLVSKTLNGSKWIDCGIVSNSSVDDVDLVVGPKNVPYVAFIGRNTSEIETKILVDAPKNEYDGVDLENIPSEYKYEYPVVKYYVKLKHLNQNGAKKEWIGFASSDGDFIKINGEKLEGVEKFKLASDGNSLYIATLIHEKKDEAKYALKVFKLAESFNTLSSTELFDTSVGSSVIAYLDKDDNFDIEASHNELYLAFENEDNNNKVSVLKWNENKWNSVGNPAFASVSENKSNMDLSIMNGVPYIVFKESTHSENRNRQGKIVPMKYSKQDDKKLTIESIGNRKNSELFAKFRHYITNYQHDVARTIDRVVFDVNFTKKMIFKPLV